MKNIELIIGRVLLAHIFLLAGITKITGYTGTQGYMEAVGLPGMLLPAVIALEIGGGLALVLGWFNRIAAYGLAIFTLVAAALFHSNFAEQMQVLLFMKNIAMAGGLVVLAGTGPGRFSIDHMMSGITSDITSGAGG